MAGPRRSPRRPVAGGLALTAAAATVLYWTHPAPASAAPSCQQAHLLVNTGTLSGDERLLRYDPTGRLRASVQAQRPYGDVAVLPDGTLYGVDLDNGSDTLYRIDLATGAETATVPISGPPGRMYNALTAAPDGSLLLGAYADDEVLRLDPATGATTPAATLPAGWTSAGDFLTLADDPDDDVLAVVEGSTGDALARIHPDGTTTVIGTVPESWGAMQSGGQVYLAGSDGTVRRVDALPTAASTAPLPTTDVVATGTTLYGATSVGDAGLCADLVTDLSVSPVDGAVVDAGGTATYTLTLDNTDGAAAAQVDTVLVLDGVLDDAAVDVPATASAGSGLQVSPLTGGRIEVGGLLRPGTTATVTLRVRVTPSGTGDHLLRALAVPFGTPVPTTCAPSSPTCTDNPVADLALTQTGTPVGRAGEQVAWTHQVTNTGRAALTGLVVTRPDGGAVSCPTTSLAPGATTSCTSTSTAAQADVDAGTLTGASAARATRGGATLQAVPASAAVAVPAAPALTLTATGSRVGDRVRWTYLVTNTGTVTLHEVGVTGPGATAASCPVTVLGPGAATTCTLDVVLTDADRAAGAAAGSGTASGLPPGAAAPVLATAQGSVPLVVARTPQVADLPTTGVDGTRWTGAALVLLGAGTAALTLARRRRA
ncbi:DUF7507 domain-containing protein [Klenkia brasiliensis]|uniref:Gram-positive cocci surface proteins LPxTG domain-containing protein n=1 Tax=Klenkia brasiliensis TaxID=333142 RepID=A0A1G7SJE7_9ACTN|nr:DUF11 domain-containing protein [Klenkia brasiliensis]SDG23081.1 hypothetical protein SAMN05660324_2048 [Klenkia brasiliensis]